MASAHTIDMDRLRADMAAHMQTVTARQFSLAVTDGANPDFYRNFINNGRDKRLTAELFVRIAYELGREPADYVVGARPPARAPSAPVLRSTFELLLDSIGVDPDEGERARKLAEQFPNALRRVADLHAQIAGGSGSTREEASPADDEDRPAA